MNVVTYGGTLTREEMNCITEKAKTMKGCDHVTVTVDGDWLDIDYHILPFERIRRITGYLVGTVDRWNNAKRAELHDRVKHGMFDGDEAYDGKH